PPAEDRGQRRIEAKRWQRVVEFGSCLRRRDPRFQAPYSQIRDVESSLLLSHAEAHWQKHIGLLGKLIFEIELVSAEKSHIRRGDAHNFVRNAIQNDLAADDVRVRRKALPPQIRRDDRHVWHPALLLVPREPASEHWLDFQRVEKLGRDAYGSEHLRCANAGQIDGGASQKRQGFERPDLFTPAQEFHWRQRKPRMVRGLKRAVLVDAN